MDQIIEKRAVADLPALVARVDELEEALGALAAALTTLGPHVISAIQGNPTLRRVVRARRAQLADADRAAVEEQRRQRTEKHAQAQQEAARI